MTPITHLREVNGFSRGPLLDSFEPYPDQIRYSLNQMDGTSFWAYSLWRAPEGADLLEDIPFSEDYIQCAGSASALTVELRVVDADGVAHQYVIGTPGTTPTGEPSETIPWDDGRRSTRVYPNEVFTADEAADIFYAYFLTNTIPDTYQRRELHLG
ncbi:hypothetical protein [Microbacterium sp.]|uniref:hypothetical protein n=1 Tax=Microbacterium sp. TaxID=51671 RepID=UPI0039E38447